MKLFIKPENDEVRKYYLDKKKNYDSDSGLDLYIPRDYIIDSGSLSNTINLGIRCKAVDDEGNPSAFYLYPRSSTGKKTPLRLSNSVGIIDPEYRGELMALVDNITPLSDRDFKLKLLLILFVILIYIFSRYPNKNNWILGAVLYNLLPLDKIIQNSKFKVKKGDRLFQVCAPNLEKIEFEISDDLGETSRGSSGFGSTGK
jgi:dUTP pyrophosphatase